MAYCSIRRVTVAVDGSANFLFPFSFLPAKPNAIVTLQGGFKKVPPKVKKPTAKKSSSAIAAAAAAKARASKKGNKKDKSTFNQVSLAWTLADTGLWHIMWLGEAYKWPVLLMCRPQHDRSTAAIKEVSAQLASAIPTHSLAKAISAPICRNVLTSQCET